MIPKKSEPDYQAVSQPTGRSRGVYCLANDAVYDFFVGLCESLRRESPDVDFELIPFDDRVDRVLRLSNRYGFRVASSTAMECWDQIGRRHFPTSHVASHAYRKFHIFEGRFDQFLFLDADMVIHRPVEDFLDAVDLEQCDVCYYQSNWNLVYGKWEVYEHMRDRIGSKLINTGWLIGGREALQRERIEALAEVAMPLLSHFSPTAEQPFLNFCLDMSGCRLRPIHDFVEGLASSLIVQEFGDGTSFESRPITHWAGHRLTPKLPGLDHYLDARFGPARRFARAGFRARLAALSAARSGLVWLRSPKHTREQKHPQTLTRPPVIPDPVLASLENGSAGSKSNSNDSKPHHMQDMGNT